MMRITFENLSLLQKLEMSKSLYSKKRLMSKEIERIEKLERVCEFPLVVERPVVRKNVGRGRKVNRRGDLVGMGKGGGVPHSSLNHHVSFYDDEDLRLEAAARESGQMVGKKVGWNGAKPSHRKVNYQNGRKMQAKSHGGGFFVRVAKGGRRRSEGRMLLGNKSLAVRRKHRKGKSQQVTGKSPKRHQKGRKRGLNMPEIVRGSDDVHRGVYQNKRSLKKRRARESGSPEGTRRLDELMEENRVEQELCAKFGDKGKGGRKGNARKGPKRIKIKAKGKRKSKVKVAGIKVDNFFIRPKVKKNRGKNKNKKKRKIVLPNIRAKTEKTQIYEEEEGKGPRKSVKSGETEPIGQTLNETEIENEDTDKAPKEAENFEKQDEMKVKTKVESDEKMVQEVNVEETEMTEVIAQDEDEDRQKRNERANLIVNNDTMNQMISQTQPEHEDEQLVDLSEAETPDLEEESKSSKSSDERFEKSKSVKSQSSKSERSNKSESDRSSKSHSKKSDKSVSGDSSKSGSNISSKFQSKKSHSHKSDKSKSDVSSKSHSKKSESESKDSYDDIFDKAETIDEQSGENEKSNGSEGQDENFGSNFNKNFTKFYAKKE